MDKLTCPACGAELPAKRTSAFMVCDYCGSRYKADKFPSIIEEELPASRPAAPMPPFAASSRSQSDWQPTLRRAVDDWQPAIRRGLASLPFLIPLWSLMRGGACRRAAMVILILMLLCVACFCLTSVFGVSSLDFFHLREFFSGR